MADNRKLYKEAVNAFGHAHQIEIAVKEFASLIRELQKNKLNYRGLPNDIAKAIADAEIMCSQLRLIFQGVPDEKKQRLVRLDELIKQRKGVI